jgi:integrase
MRGSVIKRGRVYSLRFDAGRDPVTGKRVQHYVTVRGNKKEAEQRLADLLHQLDTGTFMKPGKTTLGDYLEKFLKEYAIPNLSPKTVEGYESIITRHLRPQLGNIVLSQLRPEHVQKFYADCLSKGRCNGTGGLRPLTVRHCAMTLHRALQVAMKWGLLSRNPADAIDPPRYQREEMHIFNEVDMESFLEAARPTPYYALFYILLFTGMRRSEILALRWTDIDLIMGQVSVSRSLHCLKGRRLIFRAPKSAKGRRTIALPGSASMVIRAHKEQQEAISQEINGVPAPADNLVFCQYDGSPMLPDSVSQAWRRLANRNGFKEVRLHDARHTHASLMLKQGVHPKIVQERLGHASISTTIDTYSHVAPGLQEAAAKRFDELVSPRRKDEARTEVK